MAVTFGSLVLAVGSAAFPAPAAASGPAAVRAACPVEDVEAKQVSAIPAEWPSGVYDEFSADISGKALVQIDLDDGGSAHDARIFRSSGNPQLDRAAVRAALAQTYTPQIVKCTSVGGSYLVEVDFAA